MIAALWLGVALAADPPACESISPPPDDLAVIWVSPTRQRVRGGEWLPVVPASEFRAFAREEKPKVGRALQALGMRKKATDPKKPYKITLFEVTPSMLCRPVAGAEEGFLVTGVPACGRWDAPNDGTSGCGYALDRADGTRSFTQYRVRWKDAAAAGFCVLPFDSYLKDSAQ